MKRPREMPAELRLVGEYISSILASGRGLRLGEAAVVSRRVHVIEPASAHHVKVLGSADAGQVFYGRRLPNEIIHVDVFHEVGHIDHRMVAASIINTFKTLDEPKSLCLLDYMDVQTATGGGRVTGSLEFGKKPSLRRAHMSHVHVALKLEDELAWSLVLLVAAIEEAICSQGFGLRMVERITNVGGTQGTARLDLSDYASDSDSLLRESSSGQWSSAADEWADMQLALELADDMGGIDEASCVLEALEHRARGHLTDWLSSRRDCPCEVGDELVKKGLVEKGKWGYCLTEKGKRVAQIFRYRRKELEALFKRMLRKLPAVKCAPARSQRPWKNLRPGECLRRSTAMVPERGEWVGEIAVPETVIRAVVCSGSGCPVQIRGNHVMVHRRIYGAEASVLLLVDASASMAGKRIRAAKHLARHLLLSTKGKVAIAAFQENSVKLVAPFTRNYRRLEDGIRSIQPSGLTPMAEGICHAVFQLKKVRASSPLLLMITDGIPTVPKWTLNPVEDALNAATMIRSSRLRFACIGLEPNRPFLEEVAARAKGNLYVVAELEKQVLFSIAKAETANH